MFLFCVEYVEHRGLSCSDVCACEFHVCLCLCMFVRVFCVLRFSVINVKRWGATGIKLLRWIGSRKWGLGRQGAHYTRTLNSKSQVHHFQPPCKIAHIVHVLRILWTVSFCLTQFFFKIRKGEIKSMMNTKCRHKIHTKCVKIIKFEKIQTFEEKK